jgi:hypothetical protein
LILIIFTIKDKRKCWIGGFSDDILNLDFLLRKSKRVKSLTFIPTVEESIRGDFITGHEENTSMISNFINVTTFHEFNPLPSPISAKISINITLLPGQVESSISCAYNNSHCLFCWVKWSIHITTSYCVEMQRTTFR